MEDLLTYTLQALQGSIQPDENIRIASEANLKKLATSGGFITTLFRIVMSGEVDINTRQLASIYMKNEIEKNWSRREINPETQKRERQPSPYSQEEQSFIKNNIVQAISTVIPLIRSQLGVIFGCISYADFPQNWNDLLPSLIQRIQSPEASTIHGALYCLRILLKKYEFQGNKRELVEAVVNETFPLCLKVFTNIHQIQDIANTQSAEIQVLFCQIFYSSIVYGIPSYLVGDDVFVAWLTLFVNLFGKDIPAPEGIGRSEIYASTPWWKAKKWSIKIFLKLISCKPKLDTDDITMKFNSIFIANFSSPILQEILKELSGIEKGKYVPPSVIVTCFCFMEKMVFSGTGYKIIEPHIEGILKHIVFPLASFKPEDQELWDTDEHEYVRQMHNQFQETYTTTEIALHFMVTVFVNRDRNQLMMFLPFIISKFNEYQQAGSEGNFYEKYAAINLFTRLAPQLKSSEEYKHSLEEFLSIHIIPEMSNPRGPMRERACWSFCMFAELDFKDNAIFAKGLEGVLNGLQDKEIPICITSAIGLKFTCVNPVGDPLVLPHLSTILNLYLSLQSQIDNEELISAMEFLIVRYQDHIGPHAVALVQSFWGAFSRIASEEEDSVTLAALEALKAIIMVMTTISESPNSVEIYSQLAPLLIPGIGGMMNEASSEYFDDFLRIFSCFAIYAPHLAEQWWFIFPTIYECFNGWGLDYLPTIMVTMDNMICSDPVGFVKRDYFEILYKMYFSVLTGGREGEFFELISVSACQLIEIGIQNCGGTGDRFIAPIAEVAFMRLQKPFAGVALPTVLLNTIANLFLYNPAVTLAFVESKGWTGDLFDVWSKFFDNYKRVYDRKLAVLGFSSLFLLPTQSWPVSLQNLCPHLFSSCLRLLSEIIEIRKAKAKQEQLDMSNPTFADEATISRIRAALAGKAGEADGTVEGDLEDDCQFNFDEMENLAELDDLEDEDEVTTAIDGTNEIAFFVQAVHQFKQTEPSVFQQIWSVLTEQQKNVLNGLSQMQP